MTNQNHQYDKLGFVDGENCLIYKDNIKEKVSQLKEMSDDEINMMANKGYELSKNHTYTRRVEKLLGDLK